MKDGSERHPPEVLRPPVSGILAAICALLLVVVGTPSVQAAYPGTNGRIAFVRNGNIHTVRSDGTDVRKRTTDGRNFAPRWSPDGQRIAFQHASELWAMRADGTGKHRLRRYDLDQEAYVDVLAQNGPIAWSPSGRYLVYEGGACTGI